MLGQQYEDGKELDCRVGSRATAGRDLPGLLLLNGILILLYPVILPQLWRNPGDFEKLLDGCISPGSRVLVC